MAAPAQPTPERSGTDRKFWMWFAVAAVVFLVYLFGGAWLSHRYGIGRDLTAWFDRWGSWVWLGMIVAGGLAAVGRSIFGGNQDRWP